MKSIEEKGALIFFPEGHIDSNNASSFEKELMQALNDHPGREPVLDAEKLKYISSAGLRVLLSVFISNAEIMPFLKTIKLSYEGRRLYPRFLLFNQKNIRRSHPLRYRAAHSI